VRRSSIAAIFFLIAAPPARAQPWDLDSLPSYRPAGTVAGTIRCWGEDVSGPLVKLWEEGFRRFQPGVRFDDNMNSSALAIPGLATGVADVGIMGREAFPLEIMAYEHTFKTPPVTVMAATGSYDVKSKSCALVVFVNKDNPLSRLTLDQLDGIFGSERSGGWDADKATWRPENGRGPDRNIRTWGQLGLGGTWKDAPIHVYGFDLTRTPTARNFAKKVLKGGDKWNESLKEFVAITKPDGTVLVAHDQIVEALGKDPLAIGFSGVPYQTPLVKPIAIASREGGPYVEVTKETVRNLSYPLTRSLDVHVNRPGGKPEPKVAEFVRFILSREGQQAVAREGDYLPLTAEAVLEQLRKLE